VKYIRRVPVTMTYTMPSTLMIVAEKPNINAKRMVGIDMPLVPLVVLTPALEDEGLAIVFDPAVIVTAAEAVEVLLYVKVVT
jgi:hypothetical protein